jgi:hypothetical protein
VTGFTCVGTQKEKIPLGLSGNSNLYDPLAYQNSHPGKIKPKLKGFIASPRVLAQIQLTNTEQAVYVDTDYRSNTDPYVDEIKLGDGSAIFFPFQNYNLYLKVCPIHSLCFP